MKQNRWFLFALAVLLLFLAFSQTCEAAEGRTRAVEVRKEMEIAKKSIEHAYEGKNLTEVARTRIETLNSNIAELRSAEKAFEELTKLQTEAERGKREARLNEALRQSLVEIDVAYRSIDLKVPDRIAKQVAALAKPGEIPARPMDVSGREADLAPQVAKRAREWEKEKEKRGDPTARYARTIRIVAETSDEFARLSPDLLKAINDNLQVLDRQLSPNASEAEKVAHAQARSESLSNLSILSSAIDAFLDPYVEVASRILVEKGDRSRMDPEAKNAFDEVKALREQIRDLHGKPEKANELAMRVAQLKDRLLTHKDLVSAFESLAKDGEPFERLEKAKLVGLAKLVGALGMEREFRELTPKNQTKALQSICRRCNFIPCAAIAGLGFAALEASMGALTKIGDWLLKDGGNHRGSLSQVISNDTEMSANLDAIYQKLKVEKRMPFGYYQHNRFKDTTVHRPTQVDNGETN